MKFKIVHILGMRRSGTTWIAKLFDSHPDTLYRHEPDSSISMPDWPYYPIMDRDLITKTQYDEYVANIAAASEPHIAAKLPIFRKSYLNRARFQLLRASAMSSKLCRRVIGKAHNVLDVSTVLPTGGTLVWKSVEAPTRAGLFAKCPDHSKVIYVIRNPCGYLNSYVRGQDSGKMPVTTDTLYDREMWRQRLRSQPAVQRGLSESVVAGWQRKERMVWEWLIDNDKVLMDVEGLADVRIVNYDALCADPVGGTKKMLEHAGLNWSEQTLDFLNQGREKRRDTYFGVYKDPAAVASAWKEQLSVTDKRLVHSIVKDSMAGRIYLTNRRNFSD